MQRITTKQLLLGDRQSRYFAKNYHPLIKCLKEDLWIFVISVCSHMSKWTQRDENSSQDSLLLCNSETTGRHWKGGCLGSLRHVTHLCLRKEVSTLLSWSNASLLLKKCLWRDYFSVTRNTQKAIVLGMDGWMDGWMDGGCCPEPYAQQCSCKDQE